MAAAPAPVTAFARDVQRDRLEDAGAVDVLVVGGGITGAGVALLAAQRGYRVALVERADLASGTSSRSSKLVHGGARYLATGDVPMVAEGVRERDRLRRAAPHLVHPLPFLVPATSAVDRVLLHTGMTLYDTLAVGRGVAPHRGLSARDLRRHAPMLLPGLATGGVAYWDARTDDARLVLEVTRRAIAHDAVIAPYVEVVALRRCGARLVGAELRDARTGDLFTLDAAVTVSATGVWAEAVHDLDPDAPDLRLRPSKGVHLTFDRADLPVEGAVVVPSVADDGRRLFVVPWGRQVYVGTTDTPHVGELEAPGVDGTDAGYICAALEAAFGARLSAGDAIGAWAGLRPLLAGRGEAVTADLSRRHRIIRDDGGLVTITGGKLTTFAKMARDVVAVIDDQLDGRGGTIPRRTAGWTGALGSTGSPAAGRSRARAAAARHGMDPDLAEGLYHRHGDRAEAVVAACAEAEEATALVPGLPYLTGEVRWAARQELAATLGDVLRRRLPVALRHAEAGGAAVDTAAAIMAEELGWDDAERERQVAQYLADVRQERGVVPTPARDAHEGPARLRS